MYWEYCCQSSNLSRTLCRYLDLGQYLPEQIEKSVIVSLEFAFHNDHRIKTELSLQMSLVNVNESVDESGQYTYISIWIKLSLKAVIFTGKKLNLSFSLPKTEKGKLELWTYNMVPSKSSNTQKSHIQVVSQTRVCWGRLWL